MHHLEKMKIKIIKILDKYIKGVSRYSLGKEAVKKLMRCCAKIREEIRLLDKLKNMMQTTKGEIMMGLIFPIEK